MQQCYDTYLHATESVLPPFGRHSRSLTSLWDSWVRMNGSFPSVRGKGHAVHWNKVLHLEASKRMMN